MEVNIKQRSDEWYEWRKGKIGSSDAGTIMCLNPYETPYQLYQRKKGLLPEKVQTEAMRDGVRFEPVAIALVEKKTGLIFTEKCFESDDYPFLIASLDGLDWNNEIILEVKTSHSQYLKAKDGYVNPLYITQVQHQFKITGKTKDAILAVYSPEVNDVDIINVPRDDEFIEKLLISELQFYEDLNNNTPPEFQEEEHIPIQVDASQIKLIREHQDVVRLQRDLDSREKYLKKQIVDIGDDSNFVLVDENGKVLLKATRVNREGSIDWDKLCLEKGIDDDTRNEYRKPSIGYYKLTEGK